MKISYLFVCIFLLTVDARRRSVNSELLSENEPQSRSARRGRARFTVTSESPQIEEHTKRADPIRRLVSRRKPETGADVSKRGYEVAEVIDDIPSEPYRRNSKPRTYTETKYEAQNAPPSNALFQPSTTESLEEIIKSIGHIADTTSSFEVTASSLPSSLEPLSSDLVSSDFTKIENEVRTQPETTTPLTSATTRRSGSRSRSQNIVSAPTAATRVRVRARPSRLPEEQNTASQAPRVVNRSSRRRPEAVSTEQPTRSRFESRSRSAPVASESVEVPRSRSFEPRSRQPQAVAAESAEQPVRSRNVVRTRTPSVESTEFPSRSRNGRRLATGPRVTEAPAVVDPTRRTGNVRKNLEPSNRGRGRSFSRDVPPIIDEQKLEVLPLFEREQKTVKPVRKFVSKRKHINSAEEVETSASENDVKLSSNSSKQVIVETRTESNVKRRKVTSRPINRSTRATASTTRATPSPTRATVSTTRATPSPPRATVSTTRATPSTTRATPSTTRPTPKSTTTPKPTVATSKPIYHTSKPIIKETVVSQITEVTSKRTVIRAKSGKNKVDLSKLTSRGSRKSETNLPSANKGKPSLSSSEEDIEESDNYPEPFKALIQAKKQKKESRSPPSLVTASPIVTKTTEKVVNSSPRTTAVPVSSSEAFRQLEDSENELDPAKSVRPPRRRFTPTTEKAARPTRKNKFSRSTSVPSSTTEYKRHAKFNPEPETTTSNSVKAARSFSPNPPRGLYSSRKTKESLTKTKSTPQQIPTPKKANRYSSRYRNDASARGAIRTSTNAPAYLPTIPTITPPTTSVKSSLSYQDKDLGVEVISFDDPVNTVPSANLVNGEYIASSTENHLNNPLVPESQTKTTEKPVSIIERIINSITAISTTEVPDVTRPTTFSQESPTKASAILKLATKKSTRLDKTQTTQKIPTVTVTSEKPTTIIERIISSLSAIQADNSSDTKHFKSKQVGTNFNTISSPSTTPITRVTKSTLNAPISTSINPLLVLDEISNDQLLQKRTIDQLLALLNSLTTPSATPTPLVVVTPKTTSYVVSSSPPLSRTTETTTTTESTTSKIFTSPSSTINSRANVPRYTTTPTTTVLSTQPTTTNTMSTVTVEGNTNSIPPTTQPTTTTSADNLTTNTQTSTTKPTTNDFSNEIGALPLFVNSINGFTPSVERTSTTSGIESTMSSIDSSTSTESSTQFTSTLSSDFAVDTESNFVVPSTIPSLSNFEVSPGSVHVFSANDISNAVTHDDILSTVTISGRSNIVTTQATSINSVSNSTDRNSSQVSGVSDKNESTTTSNTNSSNSTTDSTTTTTTTSTTVLPTTTPGSDNATTNTPPGSTTTSSSTTTDSTTTQDISANIIDTTDMSVKSNETSTITTPTNSTSKASGRSGRLLNVVQDTVQNSLETSTGRSKDYYIFAVLNNNTVLRKRPSSFPNKETPYLIVGVYPNNTIVRKFPNGTLVPMEPIVRVSGFDTRENPPPIPEITSNQVTPDQGGRPDNKNLQTVGNTVPPLEANALSLSTVNNATSTTRNTSSTASPKKAKSLSISSIVSSTTQSSTSSSTSSSSTAAPTTSTTMKPTTSTAPTATLPTLNEILNGKTVQAFNSIINISDLSKVKTLNVDPKTTSPRPVTSTMVYPTIPNKVLDDYTSTVEPTTTQRQKITTATYVPPTRTRAVPTTTPYVPTTTYVPPTRTRAVPTTTPFVPTTTYVPPTRTRAAPTTTPYIPSTTYAPTTTFAPSTVATFVSSKGTTVLPLTQPATTTIRTTTFLPQFLTTFFSTLRPSRSTEAPIAIVTPLSNRAPPSTTPRVEINTINDLVSASSTRRTVRTTKSPTTTTPTTLPPSTTFRNLRRRTTTILTTTLLPTTTPYVETTTSGTKRLRQLTEQQKKDLQTLAQLEMEQASLLRQLSFLTNLNFANTKPTTEKADLANRIVALAVERDKEREETKTQVSVKTKSEGTRQGKKISSAEQQSIQDLVQQLNIATPSTITSEYGHSDDAIIAALLKEQGIGPTTPKVLEDVYSLTTTTKKPKTTTRRPGPLMQSLNWLLNVLAPPPPPTTTKRPRAKPKSKPKPKPKPKETRETSEEQDLSHQPTHITPVVTPAPRPNIINALSQADVQKLIKQLEAVQKDPNGARSLDFHSIQSLQNLLDAEDGVKVTSSGTTGTTVRDTTTRETTTITSTKKRKNKNRVAKATTAASQSNSIFDEEPTTTTRPRVTLQPVRLRPVPGIDDNDTMVRGQLITAAVNVTRAISSFLGTALQGAATSFQSLMGSGSRVVGSLLQSSSNTSSRPG